LLSIANRDARGSYRQFADRFRKNQSTFTPPESDTSRNE
jgi:hypothetical protein